MPRRRRPAPLTRRRARGRPTATTRRPAASRSYHDRRDTAEEPTARRTRTSKREPAARPPERTGEPAEPGRPKPGSGRRADNQHHPPASQPAPARGCAPSRTGESHERGARRPDPRRVAEGPIPAKRAHGDTRVLARITEEISEHTIELVELFHHHRTPTPRPHDTERRLQALEPPQAASSGERRRLATAAANGRYPARCCRDRAATLPKYANGQQLTSDNGEIADTRGPAREARLDASQVDAADRRLPKNGTATLAPRSRRSCSRRRARPRARAQGLKEEVIDVDRNTSGRRAPAAEDGPVSAAALSRENPDTRAAPRPLRREADRSLSHSSYNLVTCREAYRRKYIRGEREAPSAAMFLGSRVDDQYRSNTRRLADSSSTSHVKDTPRAVASALEEEQDSSGSWTTSTEQAAVRNRARGARADIHDLVPKLGDPVAGATAAGVQAVPSLEWTILCYLDLEARGNHHRRNRSRSSTDKVKQLHHQQPQADRDTQAGLYLTGRWRQDNPAEEFLFAKWRNPARDGNHELRAGPDHPHHRPDARHASPARTCRERDRRDLRAARPRPALGVADPHELEVLRALLWLCSAHARAAEGCRARLLPLRPVSHSTRSWTPALAMQDAFSRAPLAAALPLPMGGPPGPEGTPIAGWRARSGEIPVSPSYPHANRLARRSADRCCPRARRSRAGWRSE